MIEKLVERWPLLFFAPGVELVVALLAVLAGVVFARSFVRVARADRESVPLALRVTGAVVIAAWLMDIAARALWVRFPAIGWWSFALPLVLAAAGIGVTASLAARDVHRTGEPTLIGVRRSWRTFASGPTLWTAGMLAILVLVVTLISGAVSSADEYGRYIFVDFGDAGSASFYGWSYGLPVLIGLVLLGSVALIALSKIASPPVFRSEELTMERRARQVASDAVLSTAAASLALTLGEALQNIGHAGSGSASVGIPGVGEFTWSSLYSSFAGVFVWSGWMIEVVSLVMLLALLAGVVPLRPFAGRSTARRNEKAQAR